MPHPCKVLLRGFPFSQGERGAQGKRAASAARGDYLGIAYSEGKAAEQVLDLLRGLEVELAVRTQGGAGFFQRLLLAHCGEHVVQAMTLADVVVDVVGGNVVEAEVRRELDQHLDARLVSEREVVLQLEEESAAAEDGAKAVGGLAGAADIAGLYQCRDLAFATAGERDEALGVLRQPVEADARLASGAREVSAREQAGEVGVATGGLRQQREVMAI